MLTSNGKGNIAFAKTISRAAELGCVTSIPTAHARYDLILEKAGKLLRVQVKYGNGISTRSSGSVRVKLTYETRTKKVFKYLDNEVDLLIIYLPSLDKLCSIPKHLFVNKSAINIRLVKSKNNQLRRVIFAQDYFW